MKAELFYQWAPQPRQIPSDGHTTLHSQHYSLSAPSPIYCVWSTHGNQTYARPPSPLPCPGQLHDAIDLSAENAQALRDHGAALPATAASKDAREKSPTLGSVTSVATPISVASMALHSPVEDAVWTKSLMWPGGDDIEIRDKKGMTMLLLAARHGRGHVVDALLALGVDVEAVDEQGYTPLCWVRPK